MRKAKTAPAAAAAVLIAVGYTAGPGAQQQQQQQQAQQQQQQQQTGRQQMQPPPIGQTKSLQCVACHGPSGISPNPMFPHLAGQNASYLEIQLENFKSGERYHPLMTPVAQALSQEDVADLAAYFSRIGPLAGADAIGSAR